MFSRFSTNLWLADASVTNVTGSNSVNVFLGLGLTWTIASIYWQVTGATPEWANRVGAIDPGFVADHPDGAFFVPAGDLSFSVIIFSIASVAALTTLMIRCARL